jgi:hypothetical protein
MKTKVYRYDGAIYEIEAPEVLIPDEPMPEPEPEPTTDELMDILLGVTE